MLLKDMDIYRLIVYAQKIEEFEIKKIRKEGKRPRSNYSSHQNPKKGSITNILPWETRISLRTEIPELVAILLKGLGALLVGRNIWVDVFPEWMGFFACGNKGYMMRDFPCHKARGKEVNQAS